MAATLRCFHAVWRSPGASRRCFVRAQLHFPILIDDFRRHSSCVPCTKDLHTFLLGASFVLGELSQLDDACFGGSSGYLGPNTGVSFAENVPKYSSTPCTNSWYGNELDRARHVCSERFDRVSKRLVVYRLAQHASVCNLDLPSQLHCSAMLERHCLHCSGGGSIFGTMG